VCIQAVVFFLGADLQGVSVLVEFEARLLFQAVLRGG